MRAILIAAMLTACSAEGGQGYGNDAATDAAEATACPRYELRDCDRSEVNGCEVDTWADRMHCGGCGMACPTSLPQCLGGHCQPI